MDLDGHTNMIHILSYQHGVSLQRVVVLIIYHNYNDI